MDVTDHFPNDDNGQILRLMHEAGDDLSKARNVDFCFIFGERAQALDFMRLVPDKGIEMSLSWYEEKSSWQVIITIYMTPSHAGITAMESAMSKKAEQAGGSADGWGCLQVAPRHSK